MVGIKIHITVISALLEFNAARLKKMVSALCKRFAIKRGEVNIVIVDDPIIKTVNKEFLARSSVTDVISFDLSDKKERVYELIVNAQLALRQAKKMHHSPESELALYVVHGFLHNAGYDDAKRSDYDRMHKMEDKILKEFGYGITFAQKSSGSIRKRG